MELQQLAAAVVTALLPLLMSGALRLTEEVAGEIGGGLVLKLYERVRKRLTSVSEAEALRELERSPTDKDAQAALRFQIGRALEEDETFRNDVQTLVVNIQNERSVQTQTATAHGTGNIVVQTHGSQNTVNITKKDDA